VSALKSSGYGGGGRDDGAMAGDFMWPERNGRTPSGIMIDGVMYQLAGQPPAAVSHGWGDTAWRFFARSGTGPGQVTAL